jgi:amino acid adenylation domain-containing protein
MMHPRSADPTEVAPELADVSVPAAAKDLLLRFQDAVAQHPGRTAVTIPGGGKLSFAELDTRVRHLAAELVGVGVIPGARVGVSLDRGPALVAALLAVWWVGGAYVPLDPAYPQNRLDYIAADAGVTVVVADGAAQQWPSRIRVVSPDGQVGPTVPPAAVHGAHAAYVIYTSGSTGRPKGVVVSRASSADLVRKLEDSGFYAARLGRVAWNASVSFDASVQQWARVCRGDSLLLLTEELRTDLSALRDYLLAERATDLDMTPSHWALMRDGVVAAAERLAREPAADPLRLFIGGEALSATMWADLAELDQRGVVRAVNLYGPTECTVDATAGWVTGSDGPHIGWPLPGVGAQVLNNELEPTEEGELYLTGPGLAQGYLGRPGLTAERFVASTSIPGQRMYRTGDLARWRTGGSLSYLGRVDHQVKVNGFRIEFGEIERVLAEHPMVAAAVVTTHEDPELGRTLAGYFVPIPGAAPDQGRLRNHLAEQLPSYMAQLSLTALAELPLTVGGKIDRSALPECAVMAVEENPDEDAEPTLNGQFELIVAEAWREVLCRDQVLATDDFFALGGHSLVALKVVASLKRRLDVVIPTRLVYRFPRLRDLAREAAALRGH